MAARQLYEETWDMALEHNVNIDVSGYGGGNRGGGNRPPVATGTPDAPQGGGSGGGNTYNSTTIHQNNRNIRAEPPTATEVNRIPGIVDFLENFNEGSNPEDLTYNQQQSLIGAVGGLQKLMARGEQWSQMVDSGAIPTNEVPYGVRAYREVMGDPHNPTRNAALGHLERLEGLVAQVAPVHEEARLERMYAKGFGEAGATQAAREHIGDEGGNIAELAGVLLNRDASDDDRGMARSRLNELHKSVKYLSDLGVSSGVSEDDQDALEYALRRSTSEGVTNVSPASVHRREARVAEREEARQQRVIEQDEAKFQKRMDSYRANVGELTAADEILENLRPEELNDVINGAASGDSASIKRAKSIKKQIDTVTAYRDIGTELPEHIAPYESAVGQAIQAGEYIAAGRAPEQTGGSFAEGRATPIQNAIAGSAQKPILIPASTKCQRFWSG